jgi:hypothetical protein
MLLEAETEKAFNKIKFHFDKKTICKLGIEISST